MFCQLSLDPANGCEPLGKQGSRGALFRLTLESYGYTFVAKGTVRAFKAKLKHEGLVYQHLNEVQGQLVPVYLGNNISLACPYFLDVGVRIVHMLLMSYAGEQAQKDLMASIGLDMDLETACAVTKLQCHGVNHCDVRPPNVLWNSESRRIMLVDLERSEILTCALALQEISPNLKRRRLHSKNAFAQALRLQSATTPGRRARRPASVSIEQCLSFHSFPADLCILISHNIFA